MLSSVHATQISAEMGGGKLNRLFKKEASLSEKKEKKSRELPGDAIRNDETLEQHVPISHEQNRGQNRTLTGSMEWFFFSFFSGH